MLSIILAVERSPPGRSTLGHSCNLTRVTFHQPTDPPINQLQEKN
jgi:hypothetical protein